MQEEGNMSVILNIMKYVVLSYTFVLDGVDDPTCERCLQEDESATHTHIHTYIHVGWCGLDWSGSG
jgi:hypothetical protein